MANVMQESTTIKSDYYIFKIQIQFCQRHRKMIKQQFSFRYNKLLKHIFSRDKNSQSAPSPQFINSYFNSSTCPVCKRFMKEPIMLPCTHRLCRVCLDRGQQIMGEYFECPNCQKLVGVVQTVSDKFGKMMVENVVKVVGREDVADVDKLNQYFGELEVKSILGLNNEYFEQNEEEVPEDHNKEFEKAVSSTKASSTANSYRYQNKKQQYKGMIVEEVRQQQERSLTHPNDWSQKREMGFPTLTNNKLALQEYFKKSKDQKHHHLVFFQDIEDAVLCPISATAEDLRMLLSKKLGIFEKKGWQDIRFTFIKQKKNENSEDKPTLKQLQLFRDKTKFSIKNIEDIWNVTHQDATIVQYFIDDSFFGKMTELVSKKKAGS